MPGKPFRVFAVIFMLALNLNAAGVGAVTPTPPQETLQTSRRPKGFVASVFNGRRVCRPASPDEAAEMRRRDPDLPLRAISRGEAAGKDLLNETTQEAGLRIILRGTAQLDQYPQAKASFIRAAKMWEMLINSPVTLVIDVDFGPTRFGEPWKPSLLGSTSTQDIGSDANYQAIRGNMIARASSAAEQTLYQSLPNNSVPTDLGPTQGIFAPASVFRALGRINSTADPDGERGQLGDPPAIGFNSNQPFDFDPRDGIDSDKQDFESTAVHEIGHALGFSSNVGEVELDSDSTNTLTTLDLFRFRPGITLGQVPTAPRVQSSGGQQVFFAGKEQLQLSTGRGDATGGDGNQASHWKANELTGRYIGMMDPTGDTGERTPLTENDLAAFDALGYEMRAGAVDLTSGVSRRSYIQAPDDRGRGTLAIRQYRIDVPAGSTQLQVAVSGDIDVDLYVRYGSPITLGNDGNTNADYKSESPENSELIAVNAPALRAGTYFVAVGNYSDDSAFYAVSATVIKNNDVLLSSGAAQSGAVSAPAQEEGFATNATQYQIQVPGGATRLQINLNGNQDVDLYVRYGQRVLLFPDGNTEADFRSESPGGAESVTVSAASNPQLRAGTYFIAVGNYGPGAANFTLAATINGGAAAGNVTSVIAASFNATALASESIAAAFGSGLATGAQSATTSPLPTALGGTTVRVRDAAGVERPAPLFFVSPTQVNYQIPPGTATGAATVTVTSAAGTVSTGTSRIDPVAPGLFSADSSGQGVVAGLALRVKPNGAQTVEPLARYDAGQGKIVPIPLDLGPATDQVYLILFGTGLRFRSGLSAVSLAVGGVNAPALFVGAQGGYVGLDQINALVPRSLIGRGDVEVSVSVDGRTANRVRVTVK